MKYYAGLDVSLEETSICIVDGEGSIVAERKVGSEPRAIAEALRGMGFGFERVGSSWATRNCCPTSSAATTQ